MKISDFKDVEKLYTIRDRLKNSIRNIENGIDTIEAEFPDSGGVGDEFSHGYSCHLSKHSDGSGLSVDLSGCYVAHEVYLATRYILVNKLSECEETLRSVYDVEIDE